MEITEQNLEALSTYLRKTLSPKADERSEGKFLVRKIFLYFH